MHELAASLLVQQQYQEGLYAAEKHLFYLAIKTLMREKRRNIGMLNALAYSFTPKQTNEDRVNKISEEWQNRNNQNNPKKTTINNNDTTIIHNDSIKESQHQLEEQKMHEEWIPVKYGSRLRDKDTAQNQYSNRYEILNQFINEQDEENDDNEDDESSLGTTSTEEKLTAETLQDRNTTSLRKTIQELTEDKQNIEEQCDIEVLTVQALQDYLASLETDYQHVIQGSDKDIQRLKKEKQELHEKCFKFHKRKELDKWEITNLKKKTMTSYRATSTH